MSTDRPPPEPQLDSPPPAPPDLLTTQVIQALEQPKPEHTWMQSALLLGITLALFAFAGFFQNTVTDLVLLVAILLFHESGHYLGMRLFNYQDVKMFFIPFFGAAVSGRSTSVEGWKEAIVLLLGPLPGIVLGLVLGLVCFFYDSAVLRAASTWLLAINGFNLLPLLPLDGGRIMHLIVFSRQRHLEALFRVVAAALLGLFAWAASAWVLAIPAFFLLAGTRAQFKLSKLARQLRGPDDEDSQIDLAATIPRDLAIPLIACVRAAFPLINQPAPLANLVRQLWERMHLQPPGLVLSVLLLVIYGGTLLGTPVAAVLFSVVPMELVVAGQGQDGAPVRRLEVRRWGALHQSTELGHIDLPHGRHIEYFPTSGRVKVEGTYVHGQRHGAWTTYREDGGVESRVFFRHGEQVGGL